MGKQREFLLNVRIPVELKKRIDEYCRGHGVKIKFLVTQAIIEYLEKHGG
jgi:hypothetical protein